MILTNILPGKKYGVVQTDSPIWPDFLFLTIKLNCSDRIFPKNNMWKVALVPQNVQNFKKFTEGNARKFTVNSACFGYADVIKYQENPTILCERTQITTAGIISARAVIKL